LHTFQNRNQNTWKKPGFKKKKYFVDIYFGYLFYHSLNQRKYYQANYINKPFSKKAGLILVFTVTSDQLSVSDLSLLTKNINFLKKKTF